jgi:GxxExxY protein
VRIDINDKGPDSLLYKDEVYSIVGAAFEVYNTLGSGFLEAVYQEALAIELRIRQIPFQEQAQVNIEYKREPLKTRYCADFLCYSQLLVEIKALEYLTSNNESQLLNYMNGTKLSVGVLINFGNASRLEWKRFVL